MTENDYNVVARQMIDFGLNLNPVRIHVKVPDADETLRRLLALRIGNTFKWLPEYDKVTEWMADNQYRGLLLMGNVGRGKTEIARNIIPTVINYYCGRIVNCYDAVDLSARSKEFLDNNWPLCIDDLGTEDAKGHEVFARLADQMEKRGRFLIVTTNLTPNGDKQSIESLYGDRVLDRLRGNMKMILFKGESMRG